MGKLIALGGPKNLEWLPDLGLEKYVIPVPVKFEAYQVSFDDVSPLVPRTETAIYLRDKVFNLKTGRAKDFYRFEGTSGKEAEVILSNWLIDAFIDMEDE